MKELIIAPSILSADFSDIATAIKDIEISGCPWIHLDVMDGHFVPNLTFGSKMIDDIRKRTKLFL
ncbi:MAG TPA: ribulose-phosphate 3-epimerase, partial [Spirochaetales bacterium]|nr:ribulose-phosphate 3-epimerase [Spirochaetales bacterium]